MIRNNNHSLYINPQHTKHFIQRKGAKKLGVIKILTIRIFTLRHGMGQINRFFFIDFSEYRFELLPLKLKSLIYLMALR